MITSLDARELRADYHTNTITIQAIIPVQRVLFMVGKNSRLSDDIWRLASLCLFKRNQQLCLAYSQYMTWYPDPSFVL